MLVMFDFAATQLRYIKAAATLIPTFRPDGLAPAAIQALIDAAAPVRATYITKHQDLSDARQNRRDYIEDLHEGCVSFAGQARNRFRNDPSVVERLGKLPHEDRNFQDTIARADAIIALWPKLPLVGSPLAQFKYGQDTEDFTLADFTDLRDGAVTADGVLPGIDQDFQQAEGALHRKLEELQDFAQAAIALGRERYRTGTTEREIIDAIPDYPPQHVPGQAVIDTIALEGTLAVKLTFHAEHGTSYDVFRRVAESGTEYELVAEDLIVKEYTSGGLTAGTTYEYTVRGKNSRGDGPLSDPATLTV